MSNGSIELHPEIQRLLEENALLRDELAARLGAMHDLQHTGKADLLALYQTKLGPWELRLLEAQCASARLRRKVELAQASLNRGEPPDAMAIEVVLKAEFLDWQQRVRETVKQIEAAQYRLNHRMSPEEGEELRKLYYGLVKKLHPDANPNLSEALKGLWPHVVAAYEAGDIQRLKALALLVAEHSPVIAAAMGAAALRDERGRLQCHLMHLLGQFAETMKQPPFSLRGQWEDEEWVAQRRQELEARTAAANEQAQGLEKHLQALLAVYGSGKQPGLN